MAFSFYRQISCIIIFIIIAFGNNFFTANYHRRSHIPDKEQLIQINIPIDVWNASLSPDKTKIGYIGKATDNKIKVLFYDLTTNNYTEVYVIQPEDWGNNLEPIIYVDWGTDDELYFDAPEKGVPCIYRYSLKEKNTIKVTSNARVPRVSNDGLLLSYIMSDVYNGSGQNQKQTAIVDTNTGKLLKEFRDYKNIIFANQKIFVVGFDDIIVLNKQLKEIKNVSINGTAMLFNLVDEALDYTEIIINEGKPSPANNKNITS